MVCKWYLNKAVKKYNPNQNLNVYFEECDKAFSDIYLA